ncbi:hypothetical protein AVEN_77030-1 [Araneus ventricosus]|uniref:Uncharacterized protein n=1 Tax=Araneus ventricosus TaxID=182803 RepID=A0A4Y2G1J2_ARAVE|nr:hypothetical protein AVEN_77030-1 [Araneus ventricosus]
MSFFCCEGLFEGFCVVGLNNKNFGAELEAIRQASLRLADLKTAYMHAVFVVDSEAAILSLRFLHDSDSVRVGETRKKIYELNCSGWMVLFQWIPNHCDIPGAERADSLAKHGCSLPQHHIDIKRDQAYSTIIRSATKFIRRAQEIDAKGKIWEILLHNPVTMDLPRLIFTTNFIFLKRHDYRQGHLHRIRVKENLVCPLCSTEEIMHFKHLTVCPILANTNLKVSSS